MADILLVDDSDIDRTLASRLLEQKATWSIRQAVDGRQAIEEVRRQPPDVIVTDINMPEMNGLELLELVVVDFPDIPVILMTAKGSESLAVEALHRGAASYVPKSRLAAVLSETVERAWFAAGDLREDSIARRQLTDIVFNFSVESDLPSLMAVTRYLQEQLAGFCECPQTTRLQMTTALEEALTNAYYYGSLELNPAATEDYKQQIQLAEERRNQRPYSQRRIQIHAAFSKERAIYTVADEGPGFDPSTLPDPSDAELLVSPSGRGMSLMRTFMDEVAFNEKGNEITLVKRFDR